MQEWNTKHFKSEETKLDSDLQKGSSIRAAGLLLDEVHRNPDEFKALVKRSMALNDSGSNAVNHLNIDKDGNVFVWDATEHNGIYAGTDKSLAPTPIAPPVPPPAEAASLQPAPPTVESAQAPMQAPPAEVPPPAPMYQGRVESSSRPQEAVCAAPHKFDGLNLGVLRIGVYDKHSFGLGGNIGIARADGMIGKHTGVDGRVGLPNLGACAQAGVDIDENGVHGSAAVKANVADVVGGAVEVGADLGPTSGAYASAEGEALGAHSKVSEVVTADDRGLSATHTADVGFLNVVGADSRAHAELSADSKVSTSAGVYVGPASIETGGGVETNGNTVINPRSYLDFGSGRQHSTIHAEGQIGPSYDARAGIGVTDSNEAAPQQWRNGEIQAGVGVSGIGIKAVDSSTTAVKQSAVGVGSDYQP